MNDTKQQIVKCNNCGKEIGILCFETYMRAIHEFDEKHTKRLFCSRECYNDFKKRFEIETYNGNPIYCFDIDGEKRYVPYFDSLYYFTTLEDCKKRMDTKNISIIW